MLVLVSRDGVLSKARSRVMTLVLDAAVHTYPSEGLQLDAPGLAQGATEVWISPEARERLMLRFVGKTRTAVLRSPPRASTAAWSWFLAHTCPAATIRAIGPELSLENTFSPALVPTSAALTGYTFGLLAGLFHELKKFVAADALAAQAAAAWLAGIPDGLLKPFCDLASPEAWNRGQGQYRESALSRGQSLFDRIVSIVPESQSEIVQGWGKRGPVIGEAIRTRGAVEYWQQFCELSQDLASDPELPTYRASLEQLIRSIFPDHPSPEA